jgi:hypothetical protein
LQSRYDAGNAPVFNVCPLKGIIGDYKEQQAEQASRDESVKASEAEKK